MRKKVILCTYLIVCILTQIVTFAADDLTLSTRDERIVTVFKETMKTGDYRLLKKYAAKGSVCHTYKKGQTKDFLYFVEAKSSPLWRAYEEENYVKHLLIEGIYFYIDDAERLKLVEGKIQIALKDNYSKSYFIDYMPDFSEHKSVPIKGTYAKVLPDVYKVLKQRFGTDKAQNLLSPYWDQMDLKDEKKVSTTSPKGSFSNPLDKGDEVSGKVLTSVVNEKDDNKTDSLTFSFKLLVEDIVTGSEAERSMSKRSIPDPNEEMVPCMVKITTILTPCKPMNMKRYVFNGFNILPSYNGYTEDHMLRIDAPVSGEENDPMYPYYGYAATEIKGNSIYRTGWIKTYVPKSDPSSRIQIYYDEADDGGESRQNLFIKIF